MLFFRWVVLLLLVAGLVCLAMYIGTGRRQYQVWAVRIVKWTVIAALGFFAVLILERLAMMV
ncbi:MAG TPA: hypothetical protein VNU71_21765 [Burkholderiaceae bacterium]|nr:hypothetical protein [Burkholderiaceae bacterium]